MFGKVVRAWSIFVWFHRIHSLSVTKQSQVCNSFWVYDNLGSPDGLPLIKSQLTNVSKLFPLCLLGPAPDLRTRFISAFSALVSFVRFFFSCKQFDQYFNILLEQRLLPIVSNAQRIVLGSSRSTFGEFLINRCSAMFYEVQHGLPDSTYFHFSNVVFLARNSYSGYEALRSGCRVICIDSDLELPATKPGSSTSFIHFRLYSKNPGGGCQLSELTNFESKFIKWVQSQNGVPSIQLHPRDNFIKFVLRHRNPLLIRYLLRNKRVSRVVVGSATTALCSEARIGDGIVNFRLQSQCSVQHKLYDIFVVRHEVSKFEEFLPFEVSLIEN